jgi:hypothetical protein
MKKIEEGRDKGRLARETLTRARGFDEPSLDRILLAVPALQAEARLRRAGAALATEGNGARMLVPKLALATALIAVLAAVALYRDRDASRAPSAPLDSLILSGASTDEDVLLDAVLASGRNDG